MSDPTTEITHTCDLGAGLVMTGRVSPDSPCQICGATDADNLELGRVAQLAEHLVDRKSSGMAQVVDGEVAGSSPAPANSTPEETHIHEWVDVAPGTPLHPMVPRFLCPECGRLSFTDGGSNG